MWATNDVDGVTVGSCAVDPANTVTLVHGTLDVDYGTPYTVPLEVANNMLNVDSESSPNGINDGEIRLSEAEVSLDLPQAPDVIDGIGAQDGALVEFTVPLQSISIEPGDSQGILLDIVPAATTQALASALGGQLAGGGEARLIATIRLRGYRAVSGGKRNEVEAREFEFPIDLCSGCLLDCTPCGGTCADGAVVGGVCGNAQDFSVYPASCAGDTGG
ncbi:MAG: hypothetical protein D6705_00730 [Deltaproteobacteria bacterium]|nr:MAG: hypothetical protein D6705_00730 [Deltaproteobacteria bacterium]